MKTLTIPRIDISKNIIWTATLWVAAGLIAATAARADIYSWQDEDGVIHFSNQNVPPRASIYMVEPAPGPPDAKIEDAQPIYEETDQSDTALRRAQTQAKLDEANDRLNQALEKVEELTDQVSQSQARANEAVEMAEEAREAAEAAEKEAEAVKYRQSKEKERVVFYSAPVPYRYQKNFKNHGNRKHFKNHGNRYRPQHDNWKHLKRYPHNSANRYAPHKYKTDRYKRKNLGPVPIIPNKSHDRGVHGWRSRIK